MAATEPPGKIADAIYVFEGSVSAPGSNFGPADGAPRRRPGQATGPLSERDIDHAIGHYVPAPRQAEAAQALGVDHLVIIEGRQGQGKRSAAIALLRDKTAGPLIRLSPTSAMRELASYDYESGHGYLVADQEDTKQAPHADFFLHSVRDAVRAAGAFLVVTRRKPVGADVEMVTAVRWERPPIADVVRAHLAGAEHAAAELLAALPADCAMTDIAKVAARVVAGDTVPEALGSLASAAAGVVSAWFDANRSPRDILDVTALAFSTEVTRDELAARLAALRTHVPIDGPTRSPAGPTSLVVLRQSGTPAFVDPAYRDCVLAELNTRQPRSFWAGVSTWLEEIVRAGADLSVAFGLSGLAKVDPLTVEKAYLEPWSAGTLGWSGQTTAAFVLWGMSMAESSMSTAMRIVRDWVDGSAAQRQTAALALSGELGVRFPAEAVHELRQLLAKNTRTGDNTYADALGTLFGRLAAEGVDGTVVLGSLARLLDDVAQNRMSPHTNDLVMRSVLAALTATNGTDDEPAITSYLRDRPDRADLVSHLLAPLLANRAYLSDGLGALLAGVADLKAEQSRWLWQPLTEALATAPTIPQDAPRLVGTAAPPTGTDLNDEERRYPIVARNRVERRPRRVPVLRRQNRADGLPKPAAHEELVFHMDGDHVRDPGHRKRSRVVARATHVSLVDMTAKRPVLVSIAIHSAEAVPFTALVGFACTVVDPVRVAREGIEDAEQRLHDHLCAHHRLVEIGRGRRPHDVDHVRQDVTARVRAFLEVRPIIWPGLTVELTGVEVLAPPARSAPVHHAKDEDVY